MQKVQCLYPYKDVFEESGSTKGIKLKFLSLWSAHLSDTISIKGAD